MAKSHRLVLCPTYRPCPDGASWWYSWTRPFHIICHSSNTWSAAGEMGAAAKKRKRDSYESVEFV